MSRTRLGDQIMLLYYLVPFLTYLTLSNCDLEMWVRAHSRSLKIVPFESLGAVSYSPSIVTMESNLHQFRDKARYWSQIVIFSYTRLAFGAPIRGSPSEYCYPVWCGKTRMVGLTDGEKTLRICITVYTQYRRVTDRQTDRHLAIA